MLAAWFFYSELFTNCSRSAGISMNRKNDFFFFLLGFFCVRVCTQFLTKKNYFFPPFAHSINNLLLLLSMYNFSCLNFFFSLFLSNLEKKILREKKMREKRKIEWRGNSFIIIYFLSLMMIWFDFFFILFWISSTCHFFVCNIFPFLFCFCHFFGSQKKKSTKRFIQVILFACLFNQVSMCIFYSLLKT